LSGVAFDQVVATLSGGQRSRVALAGVVAAEPDVLLLDEPTNHLDLPALEWLEKFVRERAGSTLVVSHDRLFLDKTVTRVIEMRPDGSINSSTGNYSDFVESKDASRAAQLDQWRAQEAEARRIRADIARQKQAADKMAAKRNPKDTSYKYWAPENTVKVIARRARTSESKLARFESSEDRVEKPRQQWKMRLDLDSAKRSGDMLVKIERAAVGYGSEPIYTPLDVELRYGERIALMGASGSGKSTLFKLLLGELTPLEGSLRLGTGVRVGYMPQESPSFSAGATPLSYIRSLTDIPHTEARNFLHFFLFQGDQVFTPVSDLSFGERSRLVLSGIVVKEPNLLLLDEPLNHLDIPAREQFEEALSQYPGTIIAATHDRTFVDSFSTSIWWVDRNGKGSTLRKFLDRRELETSGALV
jgi:ATP-binding cassette subfamily F protein 3